MMPTGTPFLSIFLTFVCAFRMRFKEGPGRFDDGSRPEKRKISSLLEELDGECTLDADAERVCDYIVCVDYSLVFAAICG